MLSYIITYPIDTVLYRAKNKYNSLNGNWFSFSTEDASMYGTHIGKFILKKELRLINIASLNFYNDYFDKISIIFSGGPDYKYTSITNEKLLALFPIGFPSLDYYKWFVAQLGLSINDAPYNKDVETATMLFNNRSRYSIYLFDNGFANIMKSIYGTISDGFVSPIQLPSLLQNGFNSREVYINNIENIELIEEMEYDKTQNGGRSTPTKTLKATYIEPAILNERMNNIMECIINNKCILPPIPRFNRTRKNKATPNKHINPCGGNHK